MRIPITMCHGIDTENGPLDVPHYAHEFRVASEMGFHSISYEQLAAWKNDDAALPDRPIMFDFDHPDKSMRHDILPIMQDYGFTGNLFINTGLMEEMYAGPLPELSERRWMTWEEIGELMDAGWHIGSHTHTHPNLSELSEQDPTGEILRGELAKCDDILRRQLGITTQDFAFTGTSWSSAAEREVKQRYRFGRLWIIGSTYLVDGQEMRYAELVGVEGEDEADGGPPTAARYITKNSDPYRLPSMEMSALIFEPDAFCSYLQGALNG